MANILILYNHYRHPARVTHLEHLYSFQRYSSHRCFYLNLVVRKVPRYIRDCHWDLVIFHTSFLSPRGDNEYFVRNTKKVEFLRDSDAVKIALPQDEFNSMNLVCDFINEFNVDHVFSVAPESEWSKIYCTVDLQRTEVHKVLTGYIDDAAVKKVEKLAKGTPRTIDIGYRTHQIEYWLGRHALQKKTIADVNWGRGGLSTDISNRVEDTILGDDWYRFLLKCKYQIGIESGASILDWDGTYRKRTNEYLLQHPDANFEEVEQACFPSVDGSLKLFALSPRHLECCLTETCQVLVEGDYDGVLIPGEHYIELKRDYSNLDGVLDALTKDRLRKEITTRAWWDIVQSGKYSYRQFVEYILQTALGGQEQKQEISVALWRREQLFDRISWLTIAILYCIRGAVEWVLPKKAYLALMSLLKKRL